MAKRQPKAKPRSFESTGAPNDTSARIFESMLLSVAWRDLKPRERQLYLYAKAQFFGKRKPRQDFPDIAKFEGDDCFYLNLGAVERYGIYTRNGAKEFYKDIKALVEHGFIEVLSSGKNTKTKSIYRYSSAWKTWKP